MEEKDKMVEFYMHKLIFIDMSLWDQNFRMGDVHLMALTSLVDP